jgi:hypothetical protein
LLIALSLESAVAWQLLRLRWLSRNSPDESGRNVLSDVQHQTVNLLRSRRGIAPSLELTVANIIDALCKLGMHLNNNGPPGWMVLKRGLKKLNIPAEGLSLARRGIVESQSNRPGLDQDALVQIGLARIRGAYWRDICRLLEAQRDPFSTLRVPKLLDKLGLA